MGSRLRGPEPGSGFPDPRWGSGAHDPGHKGRGPRSGISNPPSRIWDPKSGTPDLGHPGPGSRIRHPRRRAPDQRLLVLDPGSGASGLGTRTKDPGPELRKKNLMETIKFFEHCQWRFRTPSADGAEKKGHLLNSTTTSVEGPPSKQHNTMFRKGQCLLNSTRGCLYRRTRNGF